MRKITADDIQAIRDALKPDIEQVEKRFENKLTDIKNQIVSFKDEILKEIQNLRVDVTITTGYRDTIEDHDQRIEILEKHTKHPPVTS